jgi:hypothetical protein
MWGWILLGFATGLLVGGWIGAFVGVIVMCLCVISKRGGE